MYRAVKFSQMYSSDGTSLTALHSDRATFLDIVSETDTAAELKKIATDMGLAYHKKSVRVSGAKAYRHDMPVTTRVIELCEREASTWRQNETWPIYLAWLKIPEVDGLTLRTVVSDDVSDDESNAFRGNGSDYQFGVGQFGDDENGQAVIALSSHSFNAIGPSLGYSIKAMCALYGGDESSLTFDDQVFYCSGCQTLQEESDGYQYRYRFIDGELFGVDCGCASEAELAHIDSFVNDSEKSITAETAESMVDDSELEFVARYIGGWTDPGRGGYYDGASVKNGVPETVLVDLLKAEPEGRFVFAVDEVGQFQTYFSVYRVVDSDSDAA